MPASYRPIIYDMSMSQRKAELQEFRALNKDIETIDRIHIQLIDLVKCSAPAKKHTDKSIDEDISILLNGTPEDECGVWVYYPWNRKLVHLLSEKDFITVRTNRNKNKITEQEQDLLASKKIGLVGLSVGHSVARALTLERIYGELRIADFDELELSNLNRIASTVFNIGVKKTELSAREMAELDPFVKVSCFDEGVTPENVDEFLEGLDLVIDECDSLDIKILLREKAKEKGIPVIMETSDRGMLDIERYDIDPEAPILHGLVDGLDSDKLEGLSNEEKIPYVMSILGAENISNRLKDSMAAIGKTISTWPQLGSDVTHGGGSTTIAARKILLKEDVKSGRYYIDPAQILEKKSDLNQ